jgi:PAS domain S-box-containing protein
MRKQSQTDDRRSAIARRAARLVEGGVEKLSKLTLEEILLLLSELLKDGSRPSEVHMPTDQARSLFHDMYEILPQGHQSLDAEGIILEVNRAWLNMLGYNRDEVIGRWLGDFLVPSAHDVFRRSFERLKKTGLTQGVELEMLCRDGSHVFATVDGKISRDSQGKFRHTHCILRDITERKRAEAALAESEERYRTLQANLPVGVFRSMPDGRIVSANDAMVRMYGYDSAEDLMKVRSVDFYCDPRERKELERRLKKETSVINHECRLKRKDGSVIWVSTCMYAQKDKRGRIIHFDGIDQDITAHKEAEKELHLKNVALREVLGQFESERLDIGRAIKTNLDKTVAPLLASLRNRLDESDNLLLRQVEQNLANLVSPFIRDLETQFSSLSPRELEICSMIRNGNSSKEIAAQLRISAQTVHKFRHLIRKKLGITNENVNLASFLKAFDQKKGGAFFRNNRTS